MRLNKYLSSLKINLNYSVYTCHNYYACCLQCIIVWISVLSSASFSQDWSESLHANCTTYFLEKSDIVPELGPEAFVELLDKDRIIVTIEPNSQFTSVVLYFFNNTNYYYSVLKPNESVAKLKTDGAKDYRVWTAFVEPKGKCGGWRMIQQIDSFEIENLDDTSPFQLKRIGNFTYKNSKVSAVFQWNPKRAIDVEATSRCEEPRDHIGMLPVNVYKENSTVVTKNLTAGSKCTLRMFTISGREEILNYEVPECRYFLSDDQCLPDAPKITDVITTLSAGARGLDVTVLWAKPQHRPTSYNVTLHAADHPTIHLPGDATQTTFHRVTAAPPFVVSVAAVTAAGYGVDSHTVPRSRYRHRAERGAVSAGLVWASVSAGVACAGLLAAAMLRSLCARHRRKHSPFTHLHFEDEDKKLPKDDLEDGVSESIIEDEWEVRPERLLLQEVLGEGAFGLVRKARLAPSNKLIAVKMLKECPTVEERRQMHTEMELMKTVGTHPNVVSLVGCCSGRRPLLLVEYCNRGDLLTYLRSAWDAMSWKRNVNYSNNNSELEEKIFKDKMSSETGDTAFNKLYEISGICDVDLTPSDLLSFCRQIARGMEFLAANRVVHRDLAARNVLVCADKTLKIADFGLSRDVYNESLYKQKSGGKLPIKWMAIESLMHQIYTSQSDVWSFGVVVWEVVTLGGSPYPGVPPARLPRFLRSGYRMPRPDNCSQTLYEVMSSCWRARPRDRPTFWALQRRFDALLTEASADAYLALEVDYTRDVPSFSTPSYIKFLIQSKLYDWTKRAEVYERPLRAVSSNHYSSPPGPRT